MTEPEGSNSSRQGENISLEKQLLGKIGRTTSYIAGGNVNIANTVEESESCSRS